MKWNDLIRSYFHRGREYPKKQACYCPLSNDMHRQRVLGVCLGHQAIGEAFGARLENLKEVYHGVQTPISILQKDVLFEGLGKEIPVGRYHSWVVSREGFPECLEITAESQEGQIMALRHKTYDVHGIQFHPESVLTPQGKEIIKNFLNE